MRNSLYYFLFQNRLFLGRRTHREKRQGDRRHHPDDQMPRSHLQQAKKGYHRNEKPGRRHNHHSNPTDRRFDLRPKRDGAHRGNAALTPAVQRGPPSPRHRDSSSCPTAARRQTWPLAPAHLAPAPMVIGQLPRQHQTLASVLQPRYISTQSGRAVCKPDTAQPPPNLRRSGLHARSSLCDD